MHVLAKQMPALLARTGIDKRTDCMEKMVVMVTMQRLQHNICVIILFYVHTYVPLPHSGASCTSASAVLVPVTGTKNTISASCSES